MAAIPSLLHSLSFFSPNTSSCLRVSSSNCRRTLFRMATSGAGDVSGDSVSSKDVLVQYIVLRRDLIETWPLGSVVTQGCHAAVAAIWSHKDDDETLEYCSPANLDSMHKENAEVCSLCFCCEGVRRGGVLGLRTRRHILGFVFMLKYVAYVFMVTRRHIPDLFRQNEGVQRGGGLGLGKSIILYQYVNL